MVGEIDVNINDVMYGDLIFDENHGWIRKPLTGDGISKPASGVDTGFVDTGLAADYLDYDYDESLAALLPSGRQLGVCNLEWMYKEFQF